MTVDDRSIFRYLLLQVDPAWRRLGDEERTLHKKELVALVSSPGADIEVHSYSTVGLRGDADLCLWEIAKGTDPLQRFQAALNATALGRWMTATHSYLAMTKRSRYLKGHTHEGQESSRRPGPVGSKYLFLYPMDKVRPWYRLPFEERRRMMAEHFKIGHRYPGVTIHTGYSFGLDDQEFVVAFEGDSPGEFLDLVEELRGSEASAYTARDIPIFTCVRTPIAAVLDQIDGTSVGETTASSPGR